MHREECHGRTHRDLSADTRARLVLQIVDFRGLTYPFHGFRKRCIFWWDLISLPAVLVSC